MHPLTRNDAFDLAANMFAGEVRSRFSIKPPTSGRSRLRPNTGVSRKSQYRSAQDPEEFTEAFELYIRLKDQPALPKAVQYGEQPPRASLLDHLLLIYDKVLQEYVDSFLAGLMEPDPLCHNEGCANHEALFPFIIPKKKIPRRLRHSDASLSDYLRCAHCVGSRNEIIGLERCSKYTSGEAANDGSRTEEDPPNDAETQDEVTISEWRVGPGRKKSWKAHPRGKVASRRQSQRGEVLQDAKNVKQLRISGRRPQHQRSGNVKGRHDRHVQKFQRGNSKQKLHYLYNDDFEEYDAYHMNDEPEISSQPMQDHGNDDFEELGTYHINDEPEISFQPIQDHDTDAGSTSIEQLIHITYSPECEFHDNQPWAAESWRREEALYERIMTGLPSRLEFVPTENGTSRGKKHKQRGINKFKIPHFKDLTDLRLSLKDFWGSLLEKSILLRRAATGQESASTESYLKLFKTIKARRLQLAHLESIHVAMKPRYTRMQNEAKEMGCEANQVWRWLRSALEQYQVKALQSALHKDRLFYSLPLPQVKYPPGYPLLHKHGILKQGLEPTTRLLDRSRDDGDIVKVIGEIRIRISTCHMMLGSLSG